MAADEGVDLLARQFPIVIEVGDDRFHERPGKLYRALPVAQTIEQNGERKLLRAVALVGPLEAESGEALDLVVRALPHRRRLWRWRAPDWRAAAHKAASRPPRGSAYTKIAATDPAGASSSA